VSFDFPTNVTLPARRRVRAGELQPIRRGGAGGVREVRPVRLDRLWPVSGKLDNSRDTVELNRPGPPTTNGIPRIVVEEVTYRDSAPWPVAADGGSSSLQRISLTAYGDDPINWSSIAPLTITLQPVSVAVRPGFSVVFTVSALGTGPLTYQWRLNGTNLANDGNYSGVNSPTLTVSNIDASRRGDYTVL
jgi:hypothetical protein